MGGVDAGGVHVREDTNGQRPRARTDAFFSSRHRPRPAPPGKVKKPQTGGTPSDKQQDKAHLAQRTQIAPSEIAEETPLRRNLIPAFAALAPCSHPPRCRPAMPEQRRPLRQRVLCTRR